MRHPLTQLFIATFSSVLAVCGTGPGNCEAKEKQSITVSYFLGPARPLPEGIRRVAVMDAGVENQDGGPSAARSRKWAAIAAEMIEAMLQGIPAEPAQLTIVQRRATKKILDEQDLQLAGIVEGDAATRAGKLLAVDGLIMSRINIRVDTRKQDKSSIDWLRLLGPVGAVGRPADPRFRRVEGGPAAGNPYETRRGVVVTPVGLELPTRTISEISRNLTVECGFALVDATTGRSVVQAPPQIHQKRDQAQPNFLFGGCVDAADLDPIDHFIGELVERAAREFVGQLVPVRWSYTYEVIGKGNHGEAAVRALRADDFAAALAEFEAAHREDPERDSHVFGMAVACELMGDPRKALEHYRMAASMPDVDDDDLPVYLAAKERLAAHLDRIIPPASTSSASKSKPQRP